MILMINWWSETLKCDQKINQEWVDTFSRHCTQTSSLSPLTSSESRVLQPRGQVRSDRPGKCPFVRDDDYACLQKHEYVNTQPMVIKSWLDDCIWDEQKHTKVWRSPFFLSCCSCLVDMSAQFPNSSSALQLTPLCLASSFVEGWKYNSCFKLKYTHALYATLFLPDLFVVPLCKVRALARATLS